MLLAEDMSKWPESSLAGIHCGTAAACERSQLSSVGTAHGIGMCTVDVEAHAVSVLVTIACSTISVPLNDMMVRGGTFYAFQQNNGDTVHEYAAELAVRYFKEQSEWLATGKLTRKAFKCGPPENGRAWSSLVSEFFAGRDLVPPC